MTTSTIVSMTSQRSVNRAADTAHATVATPVAAAATHRWPATGIAKLAAATTHARTAGASNLRSLLEVARRRAGGPEADTPGR
jgi:hypothetical protein